MQHNYLQSDLVFDIETLTPEDENGEANFAAPVQKIICISAALCNHAEGEIKLACFAGNEAEIVGTFIGAVKRNLPRLVSFNGRGFDLPVITAAAFRHSIPWGWYYKSRDTRYRFTADGHLDLCDYLSDFGGGRKAKLSDWAKLVGYPGKVGIDGSMVGEMYRDGRVKEICDYCNCDVAQTCAVLFRARLLMGECDKEQHDEMQQKLRELVDSDPSLVALKDAMGNEN